jgi:hypothetical protein
MCSGASARSVLWRRAHDYRKQKQWAPAHAAALAWTAGLPGGMSRLVQRITPSAAAPAPNDVEAEKAGKVVGAGRDEDS